MEDAQAAMGTVVPEVGPWLARWEATAPSGRKGRLVFSPLGIGAMILEIEKK